MFQKPRYVCLSQIGNTSLFEFYFLVYCLPHSSSRMTDSSKEWIVLVALFSILLLALVILSFWIRIKTKHEAREWKKAYFRNRHAADLEKQTDIVRQVGAAGIDRFRLTSVNIEDPAEPTPAMLRSWEPWLEDKIEDLSCNWLYMEYWATSMPMCLYQISHHENSDQLGRVEAWTHGYDDSSTWFSLSQCPLSNMRGVTVVDLLFALKYQK